jgi:hypothetical protein
MTSASPNLKTAFKSVLKISASILLALLTFALLIAGYSKYESYIDKKDAAKYEDIKIWSQDISDYLKMDFSAKTKLVDGRIYASLDFKGYPNYLTDERLAYKNQNAYITFNMVDKDGFKLLSKSMQIKDMGTVVDKDGAKIGMNHQFDEYFGVEKYKNISQVKIEWTLDTLIPIKKIVQQEVPKEKSLDHCAPGISKNERIRRLSTNGTVRQTGYGEYSAGNKSINFSLDEVIFCN